MFSDNEKTLEEQSKSLQDFLYQKTHIAFSDDDPIIAEYLILNEFYKEQKTIFDSITNFGEKVQQLHETHKNHLNQLNKACEDVFKDHAKELRIAFTNAVNKVAENNEKVINSTSASNRYEKVEKSIKHLIIHFWIISSCVTLANITITLLILKFTNII